MRNGPHPPSPARHSSVKKVSQQAGLLLHFAALARGVLIGSATSCCALGQGSTGVRGINPGSASSEASTHFLPTRLSSRFVLGD